MKTDQELRNDIDSGLQASDIINSNVFRRAKFAIRDALLERFENQKALSQDEMVEIYRTLRLLKVLDAELNKVIRDGKISKEQLDILIKRA